MLRPPAPLGTLTRRLPLQALLLAAAMVVSACAESSLDAAEEALPAMPIPAEQDPGLVHVHGLGVNPADGMVYAATHFGLWQLPEDGEAERVGDTGYDLMGFTVVGPDHFQASGHPSAADDLPSLLGLIESTDGGQTWHSVSLLGGVDFHALRVAHDRVYGWSSSDGTFMVSEDDEEWDRRSTVPLADFVVDPDDPDGIVGVVAQSFDDARVVRSGDGGRTWAQVDGPPIARLAWEASDRLWGIGIDGSVWRSPDGGQQWAQGTGSVGGRPEAFLDAGESLFVAAGGAILQSRDAGHTWDVRHTSG